MHRWNSNLFCKKKEKKRNKSISWMKPSIKGNHVKPYFMSVDEWLKLFYFLLLANTNVVTEICHAWQVQEVKIDFRSSQNMFWKPPWIRLRYYACLLTTYAFWFCIRKETEHNKKHQIKMSHLNVQEMKFACLQLYRNEFWYW